jgi:glyoxylase-like metal-dependent hydrolase (beta-lactamase superfamily II)/rhodanese-related sulfurtransferase
MESETMPQQTPSRPAASIPPVELAERLARQEPTTILDVRAEIDAPIEGPGVTTVHVPSERALADPSSLAAQLEGPVAVVCNRGQTAQAVADRLSAQGTDALVLEGGMRGWIGTLQAYPVEVGIEGVDVLQVQRPGRGCLSYVIAAEGRALVVDPAPDAPYYVALADGLGAAVTDVFDTHIHADHLSGARAVVELTGATLRLPEPALERGVAFEDRVTPMRDGDAIELGSLSVRVLHLPGHTTDMTGLVIGERAVVAGDSLFADGIARPDLQRSDPEGAQRMGEMLHATLHERLLALGDAVTLLPCHTHPGVHGEAIAPTLGEVRAAVPELSIADPAEFAAELVADMPPRPANYETVIAVNSGTHPFDPELETGGNSCATR